MRRNFWIGLVLILALIGLAGYISWPTTTKFLNHSVSVRQGLDLQGGVRLVYQLDLSKTAKSDVANAIQSTVQVMERRVNATGASEPVITPGKTLKGENIITVELPGIKDVQSAIDLIGKTAQLDFREEDSKDSSKFIPTGLSGKQLSKATVTFDQNTNVPQISLQFNADGSRLFGDITTRNVNKPIGIFLDNQELSAPNVSEPITSGQAVITGRFTIAQVRQLTTLLNAGALDVPLKQTSQQTVGATLGADSVKKSLVAGVIGLSLVMLFMIFNYRLAGFVAVLALVGYTLITFALFKWIPVTLTLAGIAGFILSIGMAVDANILIFERMREELRQGRELKIAMEEGFRRAWPSVRDSNASTLITSGILYATTTGLVRGFALTLAIGVLVSLFSSITLSRTFLRLFSRGVVFQKWLAKV
ncbi:MAG TPA: protein translocase subunit SecD [Candidatus Saccharimonadales bacterium]|nr:protein translocase subunit SecD [Candidatus Saccharimonadales bacterium]